MKTNFIIIASATVASIMSLSALGQGLPSVRVNQLEHPFESPASIRTMDGLSPATKASGLLGLEVRNHEGEKLGKVEEFAVDVESGRIVQVILASGGFLGIGETLRAVPSGVLRYDVAKKILHLDADQDKFAAAPQFDMSKWSECSDAEHLAKTYKYYGAPIWFSHSDTKETNDKGGGVNAQGAWVETSSSVVHGANHSLSKVGNVQKVTMVMGHGIINQFDDKLGNIEDIMLDFPAGRIVAMIISSGGFIGKSNELSAVPASAMKYDAQLNTLRLNVSKEVLSAAPHFNSSDWPDLGQEEYVGRVYSAYNVEPYFSKNTLAVEDRPWANVKGSNDSSLTSPDQGTSQNDLDTTTRIRREVVGTEKLFANAHNVKIITLDGRVTLHGNVDSAEEKRLIGQIAINAARPNGVDNQLQVK